MFSRILPFAALLARPNPRQDGAALLETLYAHLLLAGNAYLEAVTLGDKVHELYALRPDRIKVRYVDEHNEIRTIEADGLLAVIIQHEMDHLNGVLFVDHISNLKRNMILRRLTKQKKLGKRPAAAE